MGVIAKRAVEAFLNRPLRDSAKAKRFSDAALDAKLARLDPPPLFHTPPRKHQKVCFLLGLRHPSYLHLLDMGLGKTWVVLNLYAYARRLTPALRMLVFVPGSANLGQWLDEVRKHAPSLSAVGVDAAGEAERMIQVRGESDVVVLTYAGFLSLACRTVQKRKKAGWAIDPAKMREFTKRFGFVCFDEGSAFKNPASLTKRACRQLAKSARWRYDLTGTPFGKKPVDELWSQFHVIDGGETLGPTLGLARAAFCVQKPNYWGGVDYEFDARKKGLLSRMIRHNSVRYRAGECEDLPDVVPTTRRVVFPQETWEYYDRILRELTDAQRSGQFKLMDNAFQRMRQLTAGYLTVKDPEGAKHTIRFKENPKLDALLEWLEEVPAGRKVIVFCEYRTSGELICEGLKKAKVKHRRLYGGTKNKSAEVKAFLEGKDDRVLVSSSAGAFGGNWQAANYTFWFESPCSPILRRQEEKRNHRMGQTRTVFHNDLAVAGSVDERILASLRHGRDLFRDLVEGDAPAAKLSRRKKIIPS